MWLEWLVFFFYIYLFQKWFRESQKNQKSKTKRPKKVEVVSLIQNIDELLLNSQECVNKPWITFDSILDIAHGNATRALMIQQNAQRIYGLQIGINYILTRRQLKGCINDALNLRAFLLANQVPQENLSYFTDFTFPKPSKPELLQAISALLNSCPNGSTILLSFSGHGTRSGLQHETWCALGPTGTSVELILDNELLSLIAPFMNQKPLSKLTIISDSCFSGDVANLRYTYYPDKRNTQILHQVNDHYQHVNGNICLISGSTKFQTSSDVEMKNEISHGALTYTLLKWLQINRLRTFSYRQFILGLNQLLTESKFYQTSCFSSSQPLQLDQEMQFP